MEREGYEKVARAATAKLGNPELKPQQQEVVVEFISGRDVFAVLPTGYGKSLLFRIASYCIRPFRGLQRKECHCCSSIPFNSHHERSGKLLLGRGDWI